MHAYSYFINGPPRSSVKPLAASHITSLVAEARTNADTGDGERLRLTVTGCHTAAPFLAYSPSPATPSHAPPTPLSPRLTISRHPMPGTPSPPPPPG